MRCLDARPVHGRRIDALRAGETAPAVADPAPRRALPSADGVADRHRRTRTRHRQCLRFARSVSSAGVEIQLDPRANPRRGPTQTTDRRRARVRARLRPTAAEPAVDGIAAPARERSPAGRGDLSIRPGTLPAAHASGARWSRGGQVSVRKWRLVANRSRRASARIERISRVARSDGA